MKAKKTKAKQSKQIRQAQASANRLIITGLLLISAVFASLFLRDIVNLAQVAHVGQLTASGLFPAATSFVLAVYVWFASPYPVHRYRYGVLVVLTALLTGYFMLFALATPGFSL